MSQEPTEQTQQAPGAPSPQGPQAGRAEDQDGATKLVPVGESIKYRRRAQQAETQLQQIEQKLNELQTQLDRRTEEIAAAESQRDEARLQLTTTENRMAAERLLGEAGVVDLETGSLLLSERVDLNQDHDQESLGRQVEQLLLDKPFLRATAQAPLPGKTASARVPQATARALMTDAAEEAARTGNRRDVAEYLRLRRQTSTQ